MAGIKTLTELRERFWEEHPEYKHFYRKTWRQNQYHANIRIAWVDFIVQCEMNGRITEKLAQRATL